MNPQGQGKDQDGAHSPPPQADQRSNNADTIIAVDQTVPGAVLGQGSPFLSPAHLRMPDTNEVPADPFFQVSLPQVPPTDQQPPAFTFPLHDNSDNSPVESNDSTGSSNHRNSDSPQRPLSPPNLPPLSPPFRGEPASTFRYPSHVHHGTFTPSIRSEMPGQRPYESSIRNHEYHPPMGGHHHHQHHRDSGKPMTIDYAGLDSAVAEATLIESGFQKSAYLDAQSKEQTTLSRAASTGSSGLLGPSSAHGNDFRRRSARKASFYSERAPRVSRARFCIVKASVESSCMLTAIFFLRRLHFVLLATFARVVEVHLLFKVHWPHPGTHHSPDPQRGYDRR